jgi:hypothetical protein
MTFTDMSEPSNLCPKCYCEMTISPDGVSRCPKCDAAPAPPSGKNFTESRWAKRAFWILLFAPSALALLSFLVGRASKVTGANIGFADLIVGVVASFYCGYWLAYRFCRPPAAWFVFGFFFVAAIAAVNFTILFAGCAGNLEFH